jgi:CRISPR-associated endonuclease/helicase Cas3
MSVHPIKFADFFRELNGYWPFPWQGRLAQKVVNEGWPQTIDIPTGAGKTAIIDIAVFHLAVEAIKAPTTRNASTRVFFVVDRRIVVDEAFERAKNIAKQLKKATEKRTQNSLTEAAKALSTLGGEVSNPLDVVRLRGGLYRERAFIRNPFQPTVILSTVDQVGSRLLFRGYGVSEFMRPIHGALTGMDSLLILDEVHLSQPFAETLDWIANYQSEKWTILPTAKPITKVEMSATISSNKDVFTIEQEDWKDEVLVSRLRCSKPAWLCSIKGEKDDPQETRKKIDVKLAEKGAVVMNALLKEMDAPVIGIVANRVNTARQIFEALRNEDDNIDAILLTGRIRPFERDILLKDYLPRMRSGRNKGDNLRPLYVIATQTIEVGADLDFNALITEVASFDALRQRFGRVNRLGRFKVAENIIVYADYGRTKPDEDYVYGEALENTAKWLKKKSKTRKNNKIIDFGNSEMNEIVASEPVEAIEKLLSPAKSAPILLPAHVDMFSQTSPPPAVDPDVAVFLHGTNTQPSDVRIVWRGDIPGVLSAKDEKNIINIVSALPPDQQEVLEIPVWAARSFLSKTGAVPVSDVEGGKENEAGIYRGDERFALRWRGIEESRLVRGRDIKPGDTLVVPAAYGGLDSFGWKPDAKTPALDIAEAIPRPMSTQVMRLHSAFVGYWLNETADEALKEKIKNQLNQMMKDFEAGEHITLLCEEFIEYLLSLSSLRPEYREKLNSFHEKRIEVIYPVPTDPKGLLLQKREKITEFSDDDDTSAIGQQNKLEDHCNKVGHLAALHGHKAGLTDKLIKVLENAGKFHDIGKADPRFQAWLFGGDKIEAFQSNDLFAKSSALLANNPYAINAARERAGYPKGCRHESYSVVLTENNEFSQKISGEEKDLFLSLIGVHHGRGRPFMPAVEDEGIKVNFTFQAAKVDFAGEHLLERLDSGWTDRFWRMIRCYGYWGIAYLEMLLRLSDHICSAK